MVHSSSMDHLSKTDSGGKILGFWGALGASVGGFMSIILVGDCDDSRLTGLLGAPGALRGVFMMR